MKRISFVKKGVAAIVDEPIPACAPDTMLLRTRYSAVSNGTERNQLLGGNYNGAGFPFYPGYQNVAEVVECGEDAVRVYDTLRDRPRELLGTVFAW
ncbi:MAG: hypothetical protein GF331_03475 [Chitinivibrionales bacterium]|nr:hypothetical protein [Chitinivibrionales bacterium]